MTFVRDDHRYTRGVGAVAAFDRATPARRVAAAREEMRMRRRDRKMSKSTLGMINQRDQSDSGSGGTGGGGRPSTPSTPIPPRPPHRFNVPGIRGGKAIVKSPGSVIADPVLPPRLPPPTRPPPTLIVGTGISPISTGGGARPAASLPDFGPTMEIPEIEEQPTGPTSVAPSAPPTNKLLMYAAIGLGAWWLLTREQ